MSMLTQASRWRHVTISIVGIGTWLPETVRTNDAWPPSFRQNRQSAATERSTTSRLRRPLAAALVERDLSPKRTIRSSGRSGATSPTGALAADAEIAAAARALADARVAPADVDLVLSYSIVPDRLTPTAAPSLTASALASARLLGVDAACASSITQLDVARAYIDSGLARVVLLVQSHLLLRAMPMEHPASPGLGDGATALVVTRGAGLAIRETFRTPTANSRSP